MLRQYLRSVEFPQRRLAWYRRLSYHCLVVKFLVRCSPVRLAVAKVRLAVALVHVVSAGRFSVQVYGVSTNGVLASCPNRGRVGHCGYVQGCNRDRVQACDLNFHLVGIRCCLQACDLNFHLVGIRCCLQACDLNFHLVGIRCCLQACDLNFHLVGIRCCLQACDLNFHSA